MKNKKVFVTGGAGVIGQELVPLLIRAGADVLVGDLKEKPDHFTDELKYVRGDLNSLSQEEFDDFSPEIIFHLAATFERSKETFEFWDENFYHNIKLSHHIMSLVRQNSCVKQVIFASSYLIYDEDLYQNNKPQLTAIKLSENDPIRPRNLTEWQNCSMSRN